MNEDFVARDIRIQVTETKITYEGELAPRRFVMTHIPPPQKWQLTISKKKLDTYEAPRQSKKRPSERIQYMIDTPTYVFQSIANANEILQYVKRVEKSSDGSFKIDLVVLESTLTDDESESE